MMSGTWLPLHLLDADSSLCDAQCHATPGAYSWLATCILYTRNCRHSWTSQINDQVDVQALLNLVWYTAAPLAFFGCLLLGCLLPSSSVSYLSASSSLLSAIIHTWMLYWHQYLQLQVLIHANIINTLVGLNDHSVDECFRQYYTYTHTATKILKINTT